MKGKYAVMFEEEYRKAAAYRNLTQVFDVGEDAVIAVNACVRRHINHKLQ